MFEKKLKCYVARVNGNENIYKFCLMPDSGIPSITIVKDNVFFTDKSVEDLLTFEQMTELKKYISTAVYEAQTGKGTHPYLNMTRTYAWMEFEFMTKITVKGEKKENDNVKCTVVKVTNEKMKAFLDVLRQKKKDDLDELGRKFLYFFGDESNS